jgi:hypothetical protein
MATIKEQIKNYTDEKNLYKIKILTYLGMADPFRFPGSNVIEVKIAKEVCHLDDALHESCIKEWAQENGVTYEGSYDTLSNYYTLTFRIPE